MVEINPETLDQVPATSYSDNPTTAIKTGTWKFVQPIYEDKLPACSHRCPAGNDISKFLHLTAQGKLLEAARWIRSGNPLPSTLGRVCPHPCEEECNRRELGGAIAIHMMERFLGDQGSAAELLPPRASVSGKKVAVVGGGPAGIAAAYNLALKGHEVELLDDKPSAGGFLRTGIPDYRLPKKVLDRELDLVRQAGVTFVPNTRVGRDVAFDELRSRFDAVLIAVGFHGSRPLGVPGEDHRHVFNGVRLLESILAGERPELPERLAVVGGGNTAMDVARSLKRIGVEPVVVYRRSRMEMPAIPVEVDEALAEGIEMVYLTAPTRVVIENDRITGLECVTMRLGEPDDSGRRRPVPVEGSEHVVEVSGVVTAIGETAELDFLPEELRDDWRVAHNDRFQTPLDGVFAAGDVATGEGTVTAAVGTGRRAAAVIDAWLTGHKLADEAPRLQALWARDVQRESVVYVEHLNRAYHHEEPRPGIQELDPGVRTSDFAEVVQGFGEVEAVEEARRCLECGTCNECLNCLYFCPDVAIHKRLDAFGFDIDAEHCKGCGICVEECPRSALTLVEVQR